MLTLQRNPNNPILIPDANNAWEHDGAFNGCVAKGKDGTYHMVYRALSSQRKQQGVDMRVSSIGYATSNDGITFGEHRMLLEPTEDWEIYGVEDPRITFFNDKFYIFYTALSVYPFAAYGIKLAVAITKDFKTFEKHPVTTFNSKAMGLFPEKVNGKMAALLTINTDMPPAKIAIAYFDREEDIWSPYYWEEWYDNANEHLIHLLRDMRDQVELGAPPIKTDKGWLFVHSYIGNYLSDNKTFGIEAALLDHKDPRKILGRTSHPLLTPEKDYELVGDVPNVIFPSGALVEDNKFSLYYGAADTRVALATCELDSLLQELQQPKVAPPTDPPNRKKLVRFDENPIITPALELEWQAQGVFNPAAIYEDGRVHIVYRAQSFKGVSTFGYASSRDGLHIDENLDYPIYVPREDFEKKSDPGNSGCEDPRITKIGDRFYITYTAYDGHNPPRVALSSIAVSDFLKKEWNWEKPILISHEGVDDKDACIVKGKTEGTYLGFHRLGDAIWLDILNDISFANGQSLSGTILAHPRQDKWDNVKLGISAPPIETKQGWLLLYHGVSEPMFKYKVGAMLLDLMNPTIILARTDFPLFEPEMPYEIEGVIRNVVFPCGAVVINDVLYVYYGGADKVTGVATMSMTTLLGDLLSK